MNKLSKIFQYINGYKRYAVLNILFNILSVLFSLVSFVFFIPLLQILFKTTPVVAETMTYHWTSLESFKEYFYSEIGNMISLYGEFVVLFYLAVSIVITYLFRNLFRYLAMFFLAPLRIEIIRDLRNKMYCKILVLPLSYINKKRKGDIMARMTGDVQEVEWSIMQTLEMCFREPITILFYLGTLFFINAKLTFLVIIMLPLSAYIIGFIGKSLKRESARAQADYGFLMAILEETLSGLKIIKSFTAFSNSENRYQETNRSYTNSMIKMYRKRDLASPLSEFLSVIVLVAVLWIGGKIVLEPNSTLDAAIFITYLGIFSQLIIPIKAFSKTYSNLKKGSASIDRINEILKEDEKLLEKDNPVPIQSLKESIEFKNVSFAYEEKDVIHQINLKIEKGKTIAVVGPSGGGKTTIADLISRFYDPRLGQICIDGIDLRDLCISDLRNLIGLVSQETILFNDSIRSNIILGLKNVSEEEVVRVSKIANAHDFIQEMEGGYHAFIGDMGVKLSGGQRQRICLARVLLRDPQILVFDEATSALDTESEQMVQEAMEKLFKNRTSIIIAHRLSTIKNADEIIVVDKGCIVERGSHQELKAKGGIYQKLYELQTFN